MYKSVPSELSIYTAKALAILIAIEYIGEHKQDHKNNTIPTDSLSTLKNL